jgi:L-asparaginase II
MIGKMNIPVPKDAEEFRQKLVRNISALPVVEVTRGHLVESVHRGIIAVMTGSGELLASLGDIQMQTWYRSAAKPFQSIPLIVNGVTEKFAFTEQELAVTTGSHSGEQRHVDAVSSILSKAGNTQEMLQCGAHTPFDSTVTKQLRAEGKVPSVLQNNCSGKHAGMLALARMLNDSVDNYIDPESNLQRQIRITLAMFADAPLSDVAIAIDGCSAPVFGLPIEAMARSYASLVAPASAEIESRLASAANSVVRAMLHHPEMIGGTSERLDTDLMRTARGRIISKVGAEGIQLLGVLPCSQYPEGLGIAIKIEDGDTRRARDPVVIETLCQLQLLNEAEVSQLAKYAHSTLYNHRRLMVGEVRPCFRLQMH